MAGFRKLNFRNKLIYSLNLLFALLLIVAYLLPFIPPKLSSILSIINLGLGILLAINVLFMLYWVILLKRQVFLSLLCILIGFNYWNSIYAFNTLNKNRNITDSTIDIMNYNVRLFNKYKWIDSDKVPQNIKKFIHKQSPDILALQDYYLHESTDLKEFKYSYKQPTKANGKNGLAIFSNYKIIRTKNLEFEQTANNAIYADVVINNDTLRIFAVHLESLKIVPNVKQLQNNDQQKLVNRIGKSFIKQQSQAELVAKEIKNSPYKVVVCADLNNSPVSYVSRKILGNRLQDSFKEVGQGFGKTFDFDFIPLRIDVIYVDKNLKPIKFKNFDVNYSDHYPILTRIEI
ncbi:endonuclease/exonuclease/phosphatase family protein [Psychroflexus sp. ALD_RP9]|uniref:endonuclease/exonuclease/phosphatase family protein n=1 Tax=Psychroflexus sp. ALD_RP9 TaxID=2777186 RepID=UPI001A8FF990|nr:endonuclease/exonuclease/phosphatase family protein [Psychroflexus sp. ALD_RP9]QSS97473.1 endonuclease/exonuclease/phosphatase family protein [Psychroflexus sp. ALD_RP9]